MSILTDLIEELKEYEPGTGICKEHGHGVLAFNNKDEPICLKGFVEDRYPHLEYIHETVKNE